MATEFDAFFEDAESAIKDFFADTATLRRAANSTAIGAVLSWLTTFEIHEADGTVTTASDRVFRIDVADYKISLIAVEPRQGDVIVHSDGTEWQVQAVGNYPDHELHDDYWIVRTKRIK